MILGMVLYSVGLLSKTPRPWSTDGREDKIKAVQQPGENKKVWCSNLRAKRIFPSLFKAMFSKGSMNVFPCNAIMTLTFFIEISVKRNFISYR